MEPIHSGFLTSGDNNADGCMIDQSESLQRPCLRDEGLEQRTGRGREGRVDSGDSLLRGSLDRIDPHHVGELGESPGVPYSLLC